MATLAIFIDSLPHNLSIKLTEKIDSNFKTEKITSGAGFSNNIYAEIVTGLNPDQIGYFNEWKLKKIINKPPLIHRILSLFDFLRKFIYLNAGFRRIILRRIFKFESFNIPFRYLHYFSGNGSHNFRDIGHGNILQKHGFEIFDAAEVNKNVGLRDIEVINNLDKVIANKNTLLSLVDLDNIAHIYGMNSNQYIDHLDFISSKLKVLVQKFQKLSPGNKIILFSDHGMVPVSRGIYFELESIFGNMSKLSYMYFVDSTYVRIWVKSNLLKNEIENYLSDLDYGKIIETKEREEFGITNLEFGDIIFRADEGIMFAPNFFGARVCKAMHGYDPKLISQSAFCSYCNNVEKIKTVELNSTVDIHTLLEQVL
ncbi:alkaline phosphatase family protein [Amylibacter sp.]|nr:alkaline phosphatase family protein [Amylibacter sp.]